MRADPKHILLVDDNRLFTRVFAQLLRQRFGRVTVAHSGTEGIAQHRLDPADLVIALLPVPERNETDFIAEMEREPRKPRFIALSGADHPPSGGCLSRARRLGARHTFVKPFDTEEVLAAIEEEL